MISNRQRRRAGRTNEGPAHPVRRARPSLLRVAVLSAVVLLAANEVAAAARKPRRYIDCTGFSARLGEGTIEVVAHRTEAGRIWGLRWSADADPRVVIEEELPYGGPGTLCKELGGGRRVARLSYKSGPMGTSTLVWIPVDLTVRLVDGRLDMTFLEGEPIERTGLARTR